MTNTHCWTQPIVTNFTLPDIPRAFCLQAMTNRTLSDHDFYEINKFLKHF